MSTQLKLRRGTTAQHSTFTGAEGEVTVDTTKDTLVVHDGTTAGGVPVASTKVANSFTADQVVNGLTVGRGAGAVSTNTAVGASALAGSGGFNTAVGYLAMAANTTGEDNVAVGRIALDANTTGGNNTALGDAALTDNTTGSNNVAVGRQALTANTTASNNTAVGYQALYSHVNSDANSQNTAIGYRAGYLATGYSNAFIGGSAGLNATTGIKQTFVGYGAGADITTGSKNTILGGYSGNQGGLDIRTASNYIVLSDGDGNPRLIATGSGDWLTGSKRAATQAGAGCIFYGSGANAAYFTGDASNAIYVNRETSTGAVVDIRYASGSVGSISVTASATSYVTSSDYRLKEAIAPMTGALAKVALLKPCTYKWKVDGSDGQGFIAHELAEVEAGCVTGEKDAVDAEGNPQYQGIDTSFLVATLTAAIQEQQTLITALTARITALEQA